MTNIKGDAIIAQPLTKEAFAPYGEVIEKAGSDSFAINNGNCQRHHAIAQTEFAREGGHVAISIFAGQPYSMPLALKMVERHPLGSQAFYPLSGEPWLVVVCDDEDGMPGLPEVFIASADQGVNIARNGWHGVLTPLNKPCDFIVIDRIGEGENLEEYYFETPWSVDLAANG